MQTLGGIQTYQRRYFSPSGKRHKNRSGNRKNRPKHLRYFIK